MTFRWPWISRVAYEDVKAQLKDERERTRYLMDLVADLKVSGASVVRALSGERPKTEPVVPSAVMQAIDENPMASGDPFLRNHLADWAGKELARGEDQDAVLDGVRMRMNGSALEDDE